MAATINHYVCRFEIAMDDAFGMCCCEAGAKFVSNFERFVFGKAPDAREESGEVLAIDIFHRKEKPAVNFADVVDATDIGMGDLARETDFGVETLNAVDILREGSREKFQCDDLA